MKPRYELDAFIENAKRVPVKFQIWPAEKSHDGEDYFCRVRVGGVLDGDKKIVGGSAEQAYLLAQDFLKALMRDKRLVGANGEVVHLFAKDS